MDLMSMITSQLSGNTLSTLSRQIGADESTTQNAIGAVVPMILAGLANNAAKPQAAQQLDAALTKDHDGGLLDNLGGFLNNPAAANGAGILGHIFGTKKPQVEAGVAGGTGLSMAQTAQLLSILAPIVMAALGRAKRTNGLDSGGLADMLGQQKQASTAQNSGPFGNLAAMLDSDGDGNPLNDIGRMAGGFFGKK
jgi:hypothetical protein